MTEKTNTDFTDVLESLKRIVADDGEASKEVSVTEDKETLILTPYLRANDFGADHEHQKNKKLEAKIFQPEERNTDMDCPWEPGSAREEDYANNLVKGVPLEEMAAATLSNLSGESLDGTDKGTLIENKGEAAECRQLGAEEGSFTKLSIEYEALKPMVADIIQKELRGVLGERVTANIRSLVRREIELAINKISRDRTD
jgi:hypothetical protein